MFSVHPTRRKNTIKNEMNLGNGSQMTPLRQWAIEWLLRLTIWTWIMRSGRYGLFWEFAAQEGWQFLCELHVHVPVKAFPNHKKESKNEINQES